MTDGQGPVTIDEVFTWHPTYAGKTMAEVRSALAEEIGRDQRAYALAMEGAEHSEGASLTTIVELERRWSPYDFDWAEMDPGLLANRIATFEWAREDRQQLIPYAEYRSSGVAAGPVTEPAPMAAQNLPIMKIGAGILVLLAIVFLAVVLL